MLLYFYIYMPTLPPSPQHTLICYVRISHVIAYVTPHRKKGTGRMHYFEEKEIQPVEKQFDLHLKSIMKRYA